MDSIYARLIVRGRPPVPSQTVNRPINCPYINKNFSAGVAPVPTQLKLAELENDSGDQRLMRPATMQERGISFELRQHGHRCLEYTIH